MKKQSTGYLMPLKAESVIKLTTEVKEVLAIGFKNNSQSIFSAADLWNIQRRSKIRSPRRYY